MVPLFKSSGTLRYGRENLVVDIDPEIIRYYRHWLSKYIVTNSQMYDPHISVVRKELPDMQYWGKYEGEKIEFLYSHAVRNGTLYFWVDCFSKRLENIRTELGLPNDSPYITPPDGYIKCFHATIGNIKNLQRK